MGPRWFVDSHPIVRMTDPASPTADLSHDPDGGPRRRPLGPPPLPRRPVHPARRQRRRSRRWLAGAGYLVLALACAAVGSISFVLVAAPVDVVRDQLIEQVKARTGRDLLIAGPTSISLLPQVSVHLADVSLSGPPQMGGGSLLTADAFAIDVPLLSLLSRQFAVTRLLLVRPTLELRSDAEGRRNWSFARPAAAGTADGQAARPAGGDGFGLLAASLGQLSLDNVDIRGGTVRHLDEASGRRTEITAINLKLTLADLDGPLSAKGSVTWNGREVGVDGKLSPARALFAGERARTAVTLKAPLIEASWDGWVGFGPATAFEGKAHLKAASLADLAGWLGRPVLGDAGAVDVTGVMAFDKGRLTVPDLQAVLAGGTLSGHLALALDRPRPHVSGELRASDLNLGRLLMRAPSREAQPPAAAADPAPPLGRAEPGAPAGRKSESASADTGEPATSRKRRGSSGWSEAPIDLALLDFADADLALMVDRILYRDLETGQSQLSLSVKDKRATLGLKDMLLYGGRGRGTLAFDASGPTPSTRADLVLDNVLTRPLLRDALGLEWLTGRGKITLALAGQGETERSIVETSNGKVELAIGHGEFSGIDVGKLVRAIEQAHFNRLEVAADDKTPFSELAGTFNVKNGVAESNDLRLVGPNVRVSGEGSTHLAERSADYLVRVKIAEIAPSEGAVIRVANLEFPMRIVGPWEKLAFKPELKGLVNSEQAGEALRQIGKNLSSPEVREAVKGLLSGDGQQRVKPRELIEKLLKKQ
jgi:AsmA protein